MDQLLRARPHQPAVPGRGARAPGHLRSQRVAARVSPPWCGAVRCAPAATCRPTTERRRPVTRRSPLHAQTAAPSRSCAALSKAWRSTRCTRTPSMRTSSSSWRPRSHTRTKARRATTRPIRVACAPRAHPPRLLFPTPSARPGPRLPQHPPFCRDVPNPGGVARSSCATP